MLLSDAHAADETSLVQAAIAGDSAAFTALFHRYHPMIHAYAYRLCLCAADAQDVAQETFIKAACALPCYEPGAPFHHWLYRICTNTARDCLRRNARRRLKDEALTRAAEIGAGERLPEFDAAREALATLPPDLRATVALVYLEELSHGEAARILGCAETTVSWRIFSAKRKLKALLRRHE